MKIEMRNALQFDHNHFRLSIARDSCASKRVAPLLGQMTNMSYLMLRSKNKGRWISNGCSTTCQNDRRNKVPWDTSDSGIVTRRLLYQQVLTISLPTNSHRISHESLQSMMWHRLGLMGQMRLARMRRQRRVLARGTLEAGEHMLSEVTCMIRAYGQAVLTHRPCPP